MTNRAFIIGNGTSRRDFDVTRLIGESIYCCGMSFTEFPRNEWYCLDPVTVEPYRLEMMSEKGLEAADIRYPKDVDHFEMMEYHGHMGPRPRNNAGMFAMMEAIRDGYLDLYILGFDSLIEGDDEQGVSNMYTGRQETRTVAADNVSRYRYLQWFINHNILGSFTFVFPKGVNLRPLSGNNVDAITYELFTREVIDG